MSDEKQAIERASDYVSQVFCLLWRSTEPSFISIEEEGFLLALCSQLDTLVWGAEARLDQKFSDENLVIQFKEELQRFDKLYSELEEYDEEDFKLFCKFYQPTEENDPLIALDLVENFEQI
jgi:hypothetical protein